MQKNLLKELKLKIKNVNTEDNKVKKELTFLKHLLFDYSIEYKSLSTEKEKKQYFDMYMIKEKQYIELVGLYEFAITYCNYSEKEFSDALRLQWVKRYDFIRDVRLYIPNLLTKISLNGPLSIAMAYVREKMRLDKLREEHKKAQREYKKGLVD